MYIAILGRQPALGLAELERLYGTVRQYSASAALVSTESFDVTRVGGTLKAGRVVLELTGNQASVNTKIIRHYVESWRATDKKITLGISVYDSSVTPRDVQRIGLTIKKQLKTHGVSLRLVPNQASALSTATSHHNKLGLSAAKVELLIVRSADGSVIVAESTGSQNITAYATRDQGRPKRDAFVGMLPPKLAQMMVNLALGKQTATHRAVLDPFCGTGVVLQEAALLGCAIYGTDLSEKMIDYSKINLEWLKRTHHTSPAVTLHQGDAMDTTWQQPIDTVACESYLGQPFSAPPSPAKLQEVRGNCNHIISSFLENIGRQIQSGTSLCVAVPAWRGRDGQFTHLPLLSDLAQLGYKRILLHTVTPGELLYFRDDQVVARELLLIEKL